MIRYREPLNTDEIRILEEKETKDRSQYYKVYRILMAASFLISFITSWYRAYEGAENAFSYIRFFATTTALLGISTAAAYISYRAFHRKLQLDLKDRTKTIETNKITRKLIVATSNAHYFYTTSRIKLSIEVSEEHYHSLKEGDEVSIEYTTHAQLYLGYF